MFLLLPWYQLLFTCQPALRFPVGARSPQTFAVLTKGQCFSLLYHYSLCITFFTSVIFSEVVYVRHETLLSKSLWFYFWSLCEVGQQKQLLIPFSSFLYEKHQTVLRALRSPIIFPCPSCWLQAFRAAGYCCSNLILLHQCSE